MEVALQAGVDVNELDGYGLSPLLQACQMNAPEWLIRLLLENGAELSPKLEGLTAMGWLEEIGNHQLIKVLKEYS